jgi:hypothetical protein
MEKITGEDIGRPVISTELMTCRARCSFVAGAARGQPVAACLQRGDGACCRPHLPAPLPPGCLIAWLRGPRAALAGVVMVLYPSLEPVQLSIFIQALSIYGKTPLEGRLLQASPCAAAGCAVAAVWWCNRGCC